MNKQFNPVSIRIGAVLWTPSNKNILQRWLLLALALAMLALDLAAAAGNPNIQVSSDGHILVQAGQPKKIMCDTGWFIFGRKGSAAMNSYLDSRKRQGFTAVAITATGHKVYDPRAHSGPFLNNLTDISNPRQSYWDALKSSINHAAALNMTVFMIPNWLASNEDSWFEALRVKTDAQLYNYGRYLGVQFRDCHNLVFVMGGDSYKGLNSTDKNAYIRVVSKTIDGIRSVDPGKLVSFHNASNQATTQIPQLANMIDFHTLQDPGGEEYNQLTGGYLLNPPKPMLMIETCYENRPNDGSLTYPLCKVRRLTLAAWFLTGMGTVYGHSQIFNGADMTKLTSKGAQQMTHFSRLMDEQRWERLRPDIHRVVATGGLCLANGFGTGSASTALIYLSGTGKQSTIIRSNMFNGPIQARWWSPSTGLYSNAAAEAGSTGTDKTFSVLLASGVDGPYDDRILVVGTGTTPTDSQQPSMPLNLAASARSSSSIQLSWTTSTDNVGVTGYDVYRNNVKLNAMASTNSFLDTGLAADTGYSYFVKARDAAGNMSSPSATVTTRTSPAGDTTAPSIPQGLTGSAASSGSIQLRWTASTDNVGVAGYDVYRNNVKLNAVVSTNSFLDTGLAANTSYSYFVKARDAAGNMSSPSATVSIATGSSDITAPSIPQGLIGSARSSSSIQLNWTASTDNVAVVAYDIYRNNVKLSATVATNSFLDSGLSANTNYSYYVRARDAAGNMSNPSATITIRTGSLDSIAPSIPQGLTGSALSSSSIQLNWTASTDNIGVAGYDVYRNAVKLPAAVTTNSFIDTGLVANTSYLYMVRARDAVGNISQASANVSVSTLAPTDTVAPTAPSGLAATAISTSSIRLVWSASTDNVGVTGYDVYRNSVKLPAALSANIFLDSGLSANTKYSYFVKARDAAGNASTPSPSVQSKTHTAAGFLLGINLNGPSLAIEGNTWKAYSTALAGNLIVSPAPLRTTTTITPIGAEPGVFSMLNSAIFSANSMSIRQPIANGDYKVCLWVAENYLSQYRSFDVKIGTTIVQRGVGVLEKGQWQAYGPYAARVTNGQLDIELLKVLGDPHLMGLSIYSATPAP